VVNQKDISLPHILPIGIGYSVVKEQKLAEAVA